MNDESDPREEEKIPPPDVVRRSRLRVSAVWLVPAVAILVGLGLAVHSIMQRGPTISITFNNAQGLTVGQTQLKYKNVDVGKVTSIGLDKNFKKVIVKVALHSNAARVARSDSRFWVVRPRINLGGVSGLSTLVKGAYIDVDVGTSQKRQTHFVALTQPPAVLHDRSGRRFRLHAKEAGSLDVGSRVYYRHFKVGRVTNTKLSENGKGAQIDIFVRAPYDKLVRKDSHFWNASGVNVSLSAAGLKVNTQALGSILAGGVAFGERPDSAKRSQAAPAGSDFRLYPDKDAAMAPPNGPARHIRMRFDQSVRGLEVGAHVDLRGIDVGRVTAVEMRYDAKHQKLYTDVEALFYPDRLGPAQQAITKFDTAPGAHGTNFLKTLVGKGMRAQLRNANLVSGKLYVALDFFPHAPPAKLDAGGQAVVIPTVPGSLERLQKQLADIASKLDNIPFAKISTQLSTTLAQTNALLKDFNGQLAPQAAATLSQAQKTLATLQHSLASPDSPLQKNATSTLSQLRQAAQSLQTFTNYLRRHPQSLLRGRPPDATPPPAGNTP